MGRHRIGCGRAVRGVFLDLPNHGRDGWEQARRTGTGSPLGEVVDHGCDAFSACAYATILCDAFAFDARTNRLLVCVITSCARWNFGLDTVASTYQGLLPINDFGRRQEIQMRAIMFLLTAYLGPNGWNAFNVPVPSGVSQSGTIPFGLFFMGGASIVSYWTRFMTVVRTVSKRRQVKNEKVGRKSFGGNRHAHKRRKTVVYRHTGRKIVH